MNADVAAEGALIALGWVRDEGTSLPGLPMFTHPRIKCTQCRALVSPCIVPLEGPRVGCRACHPRINGRNGRSKCSFKTTVPEDPGSSTIIPSGNSITPRPVTSLDSNPFLVSQSGTNTDVNEKLAGPDGGDEDEIDPRPSVDNEYDHQDFGPYDDTGFGDMDDEDPGIEDEVERSRDDDDNIVLNSFSDDGSEDGISKDIDVLSPSEWWGPSAGDVCVRGC